MLRAHGITHIILTGITTDVCVHTTMREANDRGYECLILADCTGATEAANHAAALRMVTMQGGVFGCVASSGDVIAATMRADGGTGPAMPDEVLVDADPSAYAFQPRAHGAAGHRHAARLPRAGWIRGDPRQRRRASSARSSRRCSACLAATRSAGLMVIHTREGHRPDLSDCPPSKLNGASSALRIGDPGPKGRILIRGEYGHDIIDELAPADGRDRDRQAGEGRLLRHRPRRHPARPRDHPA